MPPHQPCFVHNQLSVLLLDHNQQSCSLYGVFGTKMCTMAPQAQCQVVLKSSSQLQTASLKDGPSQTGVTVLEV